MKLLDIQINQQTHWAIYDPVANDILDFGAGDAAMRRAIEFMDRVYLCQHAADMAGYAH
jgi:hypothetical protein